MSESKGIIMFNCGTDMLIRAIVALYSLRKHYSGAITFYVEDPCPVEFEEVLKSFSCDVIHLPESKDNPLIKKISIFPNSPYDKTLFLDIDIVVMDKIDEVFDTLNDADVAIPHFENKYTSNGKENLCSGRVKKYQGCVGNEIIQEALNNHKAVNTGVVLFKKSLNWQKFVADWVTLAKKGVELKAPIVDESSFQVLYPVIDKWGLKIKIIGGNYNIYVLSNVSYDNPKIQHFAGNKHCVSDAPLSVIWKNVFEEMKKGNVANINSFLKYADKRLVEYLAGRPVFHKKENREQKERQKEQGVIKQDMDVKEDRNDDTVFRHPRNRHSGYTIEKEYHQILPHFFTNDRTFLALEGIYKGGSAFLICNGPSFAALDHRLLNLPGVMTFGINNGPKSFRPSFWTCVDDPARFLKSIWLDPRITKFVPQSHFDKQIFDNAEWKMTNVFVRDCPNVIGYMRNEHFVAETWMSESSLNWGNHKDYNGGRSVMLPSLRILHLLGFRKVYLLGCDMKMTENYTYHFDEQRSKGAVNCNMGTYDRLKSEYLPQLKPFFDAEGFQVFNCNKNSELKVFPFVSFEDAIKEATSKLGDTGKERSWGMYSKPEEKAQWVKEPTEQFKGHLKTIRQLANQVTTSQSVNKRPQFTNTTTTLIIPMAGLPIINPVQLTDKKVITVTNTDDISTCQSVTLKDA